MWYGVVLAGGRSSRMGRNKALLQVGEETLLERARNLLKSAGAERVLISGQVPGQACIPDLLPFSGPPGGLYSTLYFIREEYGLDGTPLLLIPVDMPLLEVPVLSRLLASLTPQDQALHYEDEIFPCVFRALPGLYDYLRSLFEEGSEPGGRRSMKALFEQQNSRTIPVEGIHEQVFANTNRPEEWEEVLKMLGSLGSQKDCR